MSGPRQTSITDDLELLLGVLPPAIRRAVEAQNGGDPLLEIVLDVGRRPEARYPGRAVDLGEGPTSAADLEHVTARVGRFGKDNRAGIERTLHRISALRNRQGDVVGLTCRVGRAVVGTVDIVRDTIEAGRSVLLLGRPGVGKTTLLREAARVLADELDKRVIVVDTSNEIAGDGDIPHPGIGRARRMQVPSPEEQHAVMIEAVENHMPEVIVIDEIGTQAEALASRTIAERGVQLIATAHGNSLENLLSNPTLNELVGGIQAVTLSDEEARRRGTQKTVLERKAPPTFDIVIEIQDKDRLAVHPSVIDVVDAFLRGVPPRPELRLRTADGEVEIQSPPPGPELAPPTPFAPRRAGGGRFTIASRGGEPRQTIKILPYAISRSRLDKAIRDLGAPAQIVHRLEEADLVLTLKSQERRAPARGREPEERAKPLFVVKSNTVGQLESFLRGLLDGEDLQGARKSALAEAEEGAQRAREERRPIELAPQTSFLRRLQHLAIERHGLASGSRGDEPYRRVVVFPG